MLELDEFGDGCSHVRNGYGGGFAYTCYESPDVNGNGYGNINGSGFCAVDLEINGNGYSSRSRWEGILC